MSSYALTVKPVRRLFNPVSRVAETPDPGIRVLAAAAGTIGDPDTASAATAGPATAAGATADPATTVAATADPATTAAATAAAATADHAAHAVPVPARLPRFQDRLPAEEVHAQLRRSLAAMHKAERSVFLWFSEIQERRLYRELGYASIQAYASEELDFSANRVNRYLHLMNDLERLPLIHAALHSGKLGWTKARAIVKVSGPATEERWLEAAMRLSRRDLESKVTQARIQASARRRGNHAQPDLAPRGGQAFEKVESEEMASENVACEKMGSEEMPTANVGSGGLGAQALTSAAPQSAEDSAELRSQDADGLQLKGISGLQSQDSATTHLQSTWAPELHNSGEDEAPVFHPLAGSPNEQLIDEGPVSVTFRFMPLDLARYEAQIEKIQKQRCVAPGASREQILLRALEELIALGNRQSGCQVQGACAGESEGESTSKGEVESDVESEVESTGELEVESAGQLASEREVESAGQSLCGAGGEPGGESGGNPKAPSTIVPRGTIASPYRIVIYRCDTVPRQDSVGPL